MILYDGCTQFPNTMTPTNRNSKTLKIVTPSNQYSHYSCSTHHNYHCRRLPHTTTPMCHASQTLKFPHTAIPTHCNSDSQTLLLLLTATLTYGSSHTPQYPHTVTSTCCNSRTLLPSHNATPKYWNVHILLQLPHISTYKCGNCHNAFPASQLSHC